MSIIQPAVVLAQRRRRHVELPESMTIGWNVEARSNSGVCIVRGMTGGVDCGDVPWIGGSREATAEAKQNESKWKTLISYWKE